MSFALVTLASVDVEQIVEVQALVYPAEFCESDDVFRKNWLCPMHTAALRWRLVIEIRRSDYWPAMPLLIPGMMPPRPFCMLLTGNCLRYAMCCMCMMWPWRQPSVDRSWPLT